MVHTIMIQVLFLGLFSHHSFWRISLDLKVDRVAVCLRERERESLFQEEGPKTENDREPTVERFVLGTISSMDQFHTEKTDLLFGRMSRLGLVVSCLAGKRKDVGSTPRFGSTLSKKERSDLWTQSRDFSLHN